MSHSNNTAFIVLGPESSGTRLAARILISGGCEGSSDHLQDFDSFTEDQFRGIRKPIVWRRSVPHAKQWPHITSLLDKLSGRTVHIIITTRNWHCMIQSQLGAPHVSSVSEAVSNIRKAYISIFYQVETYNLPFTVLSYESLISNPVSTQTLLLQSLGLNPIPIKIYNGNQKYLGRQE